MENYFKYLSNTSTEDDWGLYITTVGYSKTRKNQPYPQNKQHPATHRLTWNTGRILNDYYIVFISNGGGTFEMAQQAPFTISEGSCFLLYPEVWHRYKPIESIGWEEYWIGFNGYYPNELMKKIFLNLNRPVINVGFNPQLLTAFHKLISLTKTASPGYHQLITAPALEILSLVHTAAVYEGEDLNGNLQYIAKAKFILQDALDRVVDIPALSREFAVSYSKFRKDFKKVTALSPNQYHLELRLNKAAELLRSSTLTIKEISEQLGFETAFYFSRIFKRKFQYSPKEYRNLQINRN